MFQIRHNLDSKHALAKEVGYLGSVEIGKACILDCAGMTVRESRGATIVFIL